MSDEVSGIDIINAAPDVSAPQESQTDSAAAPTKEEIKQMLREYDIKVNGKSKKVKFDPSDDKAVVKALQMSEAAYIAMQERAQLESLVNKTLEDGKKDPKKFLQEHLGVNPQEFLESWLDSEIEQRKKSPEQLEKERIQQELAQARAELQSEREQKEQATKQALEHKYGSEFNRDILDAIQNDKELPKTRKTVNRIVDALLWAITPVDMGGGGYPDATVKDVLPAVKVEIKSEMQEFLSALGDEHLESYAGKPFLDRLRKQRLAAAKKAPATTDVHAVSNPALSAPKSQERIESRNFFRKLGRA